jgi:hypothetical protein
MTKSLLQQVMVRPPVKPVDPVDPEGLVKAIEAGYVASRGTKFQITGIDKDTRTVNVKVRT